MRKENNKCVYQHIRLDTNKVFYIGMGYIKRAYKNSNRNLHWKRVINKTNYIVRILAENLSWNDACELECFIISQYDFKTLCNMTFGGDGSEGKSPSIETRRKIADFHRNRVVSKESRLKMSIAKEGLFLLDKNPNSKKVLNVDKNLIFNTLKEASIYENMNYGTFKWAIKHKINFNYKYL
jgi:hypothetical protein